MRVMNPRKKKKKKGIKIVVQNVNGISNTTKKDIVEKVLMEDCDADVILQLDTRIHTSIQASRTRLGKWNPKFAGNKNQGKRGIQMNVNPNSPAQSINEIYDPNGNFLISEMIFADNPLLLVAVYAPNKDEDNWWMELQEKIERLDYRDIIIVGDFNQIMDPNLDCKNYASDVQNYKPKCRALLNTWINSDTYVDLFREQNPYKKEFTWTNSLPPILQSTKDKNRG